mgnify:CR=1 FL=1
MILNDKSQVNGLPERVLELMAISAQNHFKKGFRTIQKIRDIKFWVNFKDFIYLYVF